MVHILSQLVVPAVVLDKEIFIGLLASARERGIGFVARHARKGVLLAGLPRLFTAVGAG